MWGRNLVEDSQRDARDLQWLAAKKDAMQSAEEESQQNEGGEEEVGEDGEEEDPDDQADHEAEAEKKVGEDGEEEVQSQAPRENQIETHGRPAAMMEGIHEVHGPFVHDAGQELLITATRRSKYKTRMCKYYIQNLCERGANCHFAHGPDEIRAVAPLCVPVVVPPPVAPLCVPVVVPPPDRSSSNRGNVA
jgi:hypothetical protein